MKYKVITQHFGDKQYWAGEIREVASEQDAGELIKMGLIAPFNDGEHSENEPSSSPTDPKAKSKPAPKNKADTAQQNKADDNGQNHP